MIIEKVMHEDKFGVGGLKREAVRSWWWALPWR